MASGLISDLRVCRKAIDDFKRKHAISLGLPLSEQQLMESFKEFHLTPGMFDCPRFLSLPPAILFGREEAVESLRKILNASFEKNSQAHIFFLVGAAGMGQLQCLFSVLKPNSTCVLVEVHCNKNESLTDYSLKDHPLGPIYELMNLSIKQSMTWIKESFEAYIERLAQSISEKELIDLAKHVPHLNLISKKIVDRRKSLTDKSSGQSENVLVRFISCITSERHHFSIILHDYHVRMLSQHTKINVINSSYYLLSRAR
jgi:hypothetical protein